MRRLDTGLCQWGSTSDFPPSHQAHLAPSCWFVSKNAACFVLLLYPWHQRPGGRTGDSCLASSFSCFAENSVERGMHSCLLSTCYLPVTRNVHITSALVHVGRGRSRRGELRWSWNNSLSRAVACCERTGKAKCHIESLLSHPVLLISICLSTDVEAGNQAARLVYGGAEFGFFSISEKSRTPLTLAQHAKPKKRAMSISLGHLCRWISKY